MQKERGRVVKDLKNENRKRQRLKVEAKKLFATDFVEVIALRVAVGRCRCYVPY